MKHALIVTAALITGAPSSTEARQEPERVVTHLEWEAGTVGASAPRRVTLDGERPAGVTLPVGLKNPRYGALELAGGRLTLVLDAHPDHPRLWVDRDFDDDLAEERTTRLSRMGRSFSRSQLVLARYEGETDPAPLELLLTCDVATEPPTVSVRLMVHRRGTVVLGGRLRPLALIDGDGDGRFDDPERDRLYLDTSGDGKLQSSGPGNERVLPEQAFRVGDEGWVVRMASRSGRAVEFERSETVPPAALRGWPESFARPAAGRKRTPPAEQLPALVARLESERSRPYAQRAATLGLIGDVGTAEAFDALAVFADSEQDRATRLAALRALGNPAFLAARGKRLAALVREADGRTAATLVQALYSAGHPDRDEIYAELLESSDPSLVSAGARWLAYSDSEAATEAIVAAVEGGATPAARYAAYRYGARNLSGGPPVDVVLDAARDDDPALRAQALRDLGLLGHPDAVELALKAARERSIDVGTGTAVCEVLGVAGTPKAVAAILGLLEQEGLHASVRKEAVDQLRFVRAEPSVEVLVDALGSQVPAVRAVAVEVLTAVTERPVTTALVKRAKKERDEEVLPLLLEALGDHGDPIALSPLLKATRSRNPAARTAAVRGLARLGFHHEKVRDFFLSMLDSREWTDRVLALDAAQAAGAATLAPEVLESLDHDQWQVRLVAVETLAALRVRDAVLPLIERLDREEVERIRGTIARALFQLTGVNARRNVETWRRWWSENGETFAVPEEVPILPDRTGGADTVAGFYGIPVDSERVVFLIDQSGSMSAIGEEPEDEGEEPLDRLDVAVRETLGALARLEDRARVNVILFHSTIHPWQDDLQRLGPSRKKLERMLESKNPTGGTNIYDGLELALRMEDVDTVFLLSDGSPGQGKFVATEDILRGVRRENQTRRIAIHCVAVGMDSRLLRHLAAENGGQYVRR